jgi:hypothetical protein
VLLAWITLLLLVAAVVAVLHQQYLVDVAVEAAALYLAQMLL